MQGTFSLVYVSITLVLIFIIIGKYFKYRQIELLLVSIAMLGLIGAWATDAVVFLAILLTNASLNEEFYLNIVIIIALISVFLTPISIYCWLIVITSLLNIKNRKIILIIIAAIFIIFEIMFLFFLLIDISFIAIFRGPFDYQWSLFPAIFFISSIITILITGIIFAKESMRSDKPDIRLKGKLLLIGVISFFIGAMIPYIIYSIASLIIARIILTFSSFTLYMGFTLPNWAKKLFNIPE